MTEYSPLLLEDAAFQAWPCLEEERIGGWRLRFSRGFTKRANSANAGAAAKVLLPKQLDEVESAYAARGLATVYRLTSDDIGLAMDGLLEQRGYQKVDPSLVMTTAASGFASAAGVRLAENAGHWLQVFHQVSAKPPAQPEVHLKLLRAMPPQTAFMVLPVDGQPAACGIAVLSGRFVGLFEIATQPAWQGRGLAGQLCRSLLAWGHGQGAEWAYLQVDAQNQRAIRLYQGLGFRHYYEYWYRVKAL